MEWMVMMSRKVLFFDCFSGISGDMTVGALVDLGGDKQRVESELKKLGIGKSVEIEWKSVNRTGITATKFDVITPPGEHHHRSHRDIASMIERSELSQGVKERALSIFRHIAEAEGKIHGVPVEDVHFHEVGAIDSIVDVVAVSVLLEELAPDLISSSAVALGSGKVKTMHGIYPVPAPATLEILKGAPVEAGDSKAELTTPTGAGILAASVNRWGSIPGMQVAQVGYGAGTKEFPDRPNVLRVLVGTLSEQDRPSHDHTHHHDRTHHEH